MRKSLILAWALALAASAAAQNPADHSGHHPGPLAQGEVRRVDRDAKKITIKHGPIANLDMPAHTMVFQVKDPAMLDRVKAGDKVKFEARKVGGAFLLVSLEKDE